MPVPAGVLVEPSEAPAADHRRVTDPVRHESGVDPERAQSDPLIPRVNQGPYCPPVVTDPAALPGK